MKSCWFFVFLISAASVFAQQDPATSVLPDARIVHELLDVDGVTRLRLRPGYVTSIRIPDDVSSVVLGNPASFRAEHSESEPRLVFIKPITPAPSETNALITTKSGREISLHLVSLGNTGNASPVDFVLDYAKPRGFLIDDSQPNVVIAETHTINHTSPPAINPEASFEEKLNKIFHQESGRVTQWRGKELRVALNGVVNDKSDMIVVFSVMNASKKTIELLPPQIQLAGVSNSKHAKSIIAAQLPVTEYKITQRRLPSKARTIVAVAFERPSFKQSGDQILLQVAQAEEVDHPVLLPIPFVGSMGGDEK